MMACTNSVFGQSLCLPDKAGQQQTNHRHLIATSMSVSLVCALRS
jgi:hypothetical protein